MKLRAYKLHREVGFGVGYERNSRMIWWVFGVWAGHLDFDS